MLVLILLFGPVPAAQTPVGQEDEPQVKIDAPGGGEALQGVVPVEGASDVPGFQSAELAFGYQSDPTNTWFLIMQGSQPVQNGLLANWDTTTIADGVYRLRLQVFLGDGQVLEVVETGLRVRNYTPLETSTPAALPTGQPTLTLTATPLSEFVAAVPIQTPMPTNPAQLSQQHFAKSIFQGVLFVFGALVASGIYLGFRWLIRR